MEEISQSTALSQLVRKSGQRPNRRSKEAKNQQGENHSPCFIGHSTDFLKTPFKPIYSFDTSAETEIDIKKVIKDLKSALLKYETITDFKYDLSSNGLTDLEYIDKLLIEAKKNVPDLLYDVVIEKYYHPDEYVFTMYKQSNWDDDTLWYIPCDWLLHIKNKALHDASVKFINCIAKGLGINFWNNNGIEYVFEWISDYIETYKDDQEYADDMIQCQQVLEHYNTGKPIEYLNQFTNLEYDHHVLRQELKSFIGDDTELNEIIHVMILGLDLLNFGETLHEYCPKTEMFDEYDNTPLDFDRSIGFVWSCDDIVFERYYETFNMDAGELGLQVPMYSHTISKKTTKPQIETKFIEMLRIWLKKYCNIIVDFNEKNNEQTDKNIDKQIES